LDDIGRIVKSEVDAMIRSAIHFDTALRIAARAAAAAPDLGALPEWRLDDLYSGMDSPVFAADLTRAAEDAKAFAATYRGKLEALAKDSAAGAKLGEAIRGYEAIQDLVGRVMSYAGLVYAGDTSDPARAKFYGDTQEKVTALAADLLFFELELNRLDDALIDAAMADPLAGHYRPWLEDIRKERPHQLGDEIEQLFLEKSISGAAAWNRLFDDTVASLRFKFEDSELTLEPLLAKMQDPDEKKREAAAVSLAQTLGANSRVFALISNTLAKDKEISDRWRKFADIADSRHLANRVEREVVEAMVSAVPPLSRAFRISITS
jgi:oligoendopeptidase F